VKTIEIRTAQNVVIEYELALLRERAMAFIIDFFIIMMIFFVVVVLIFGRLLGNAIAGTMLAGVLYGLFPLILFMGYHLFSEIMTNGQTWGKRAMGIRVVRVDGQEPGLSDYLLRAVFHIVDSVFSSGILAAVFISSSSNNQRLGDMTANTTVIRLRHQLQFGLSDILGINSLDNYELTYPQVQQLAEEDMLLIKNMLARYRSHRNPAHEQALRELTGRLQELLNIEEMPRDRIGFLKTLIRDYIVITR
jgi:uncharacterized RDD family membrane protein YckC